MDKKNETSQKRAGEEIGLRSVVCRIPKDCLVPGNPFAVHLNLPSNTWRLLSSAQQPLRVGRSRRATTVCKVFEVGPFLSPLLPLGLPATLPGGLQRREVLCPFLAHLSWLWECQEEAKGVGVLAHFPLPKRSLEERGQDREPERER